MGVKKVSCVIARRICVDIDWEGKRGKQTTTITTTTTTVISIVVVHANTRTVSQKVKVLHERIGNVLSTIHVCGSYLSRPVDDGDDAAGRKTNKKNT